MSFSRKYPVSSYFYDPAVQPTKQIAFLQNNDERNSLMRSVPQGRFDTTYRREYLNFENGVSKDAPFANDNNSSNTPNSETAQQARLNPFPILPPISQQGQANPNQFMGQQPPPQQAPMANNPTGQQDYLPRMPISLSPQEEQSLISDLQREFRNANQNTIKQFYTEMAQHDPSLSGFVHYQHIQIAANKSNLNVNESLLRFVMSRFVNPSKEQGFVNYDELVKFFDRVISSPQAFQQQQYQQPPQQQPQQQQQMQQQPQLNYYVPPPQEMRLAEDLSGKYDPDEQAILRLMHENMREWDQINLINTENLRHKFFDADRRKNYIMSQGEIEDVCYRNRIPIQRSLTFQILEKYCKIATNLYKWPAFVDFLEKLYNLRLPNKKKTDYTIRTDEKDNYTEKFNYRIQQIESLKSKASEEERIEQINKQIMSLQSMKQESEDRMGSSMEHYAKGESWFTRFMRLANAIYSHRQTGNAEFALPIDEARSLIKAYNTVFELQIPHNIIEDGLQKCKRGNMLIIDDLLKVLSKNNLGN